MRGGRVGQAPWVWGWMRKGRTIGGIWEAGISRDPCPLRDSLRVHTLNAISPLTPPFVHVLSVSLPPSLPPSVLEYLYSLSHLDLDDLSNNNDYSSSKTVLNYVHAIHMEVSSSSRWQRPAAVMVAGAGAALHVLTHT